MSSISDVQELYKVVKIKKKNKTLIVYKIGKNKKEKKHIKFNECKIGIQAIVKQNIVCTVLTVPMECRKGTVDMDYLNFQEGMLIPSSTGKGLRSRVLE